jgi:hypothetical protein
MLETSTSCDVTRKIRELADMQYRPIVLQFVLTISCKLLVLSHAIDGWFYVNCRFKETKQSDAINYQQKQSSKNFIFPLQTVYCFAAVDKSINNAATVHKMSRIER